MPSKRWHLTARDDGSIFVVVEGREMERSGKSVGCVRTVLNGATEQRATSYKEQALIVRLGIIYSESLVISCFEIK